MKSKLMDLAESWEGCARHGEFRASLYKDDPIGRKHEMDMARCFRNCAHKLKETLASNVSLSFADIPAGIAASVVKVEVKYTLDENYHIKTLLQELVRRKMDKKMDLSGLTTDELVILQELVEKVNKESVG